MPFQKRLHTQNQRTNERAAAKVSLQQQCWRGIQDKHCRGIQDTLNIKGRFCPGFHDIAQFSCTGFHDKQQNSLPVHCNVMSAMLESINDKPRGE